MHAAVDAAERVNASSKSKKNGKVPCPRNLNSKTSTIIKGQILDVGVRRTSLSMFADRYQVDLTLRGRMGAPFFQILTFSSPARAYLIQMGQHFYHMIAWPCEYARTERQSMSHARCGDSSCEAK
jgi:hypothetical protein